VPSGLAPPKPKRAKAGHYNGDLTRETGIIAIRALRDSASEALSVSADERGDDMASTNARSSGWCHDKGFGFIAAGDGVNTSFTSPRARPPSTTCAKGRR